MAFGKTFHVMIQGVDNTGHAFASAAGNAQTFGGTLGRVATRMGIVAGVASAAIGIWGIKAAATFEQTQIAFEGILGSVEKSDKMIADLRAFANVTPFQFQGLTVSAKQLMAVGFAADEIIPTLTSLGNVAATLGVGEAEIAGVVRALGQMKGKGKANAQDLNQISEQLPGFSSITVMAREMGITVAEAMKKMKDGMIPADDALRMILKGMDEFPGAAGAMQRQSETLNGRLSTMKDVLTNTAIDFITPYLPALSNGVLLLTGWVTNTLVPGLQKLIDTIVKDVIPALVSISNWVIEHKPLLIGLGIAIGVALVHALVVATVAFAAAHGAMIILGIAITALVAGVIYAYENWAWFRKTVDTVADICVNVLWPALKKVADFVADVLNFVIKDIQWRFETAFGAISWAIQTMWKIVEPIFNFMKDRIEDLIGPLQTVLGAAGKVGGFIGGIGGGGLDTSKLVPKRAMGGHVGGGNPYIVGERGPEWFVPGRSGTIIPNGGNSTHVTETIVLQIGGDQLVAAVREYERSNGDGWRN
jgi:tape measure domain-containing protein